MSVEERHGFLLVEINFLGCLGGRRRRRKIALRFVNVLNIKADGTNLAFRGLRVYIEG